MSMRKRKPAASASSSDEDSKPAQKAKIPKSGKSNKVPSKQPKSEVNEKTDDGINKWWNDAPREDGIKWTSLEHNGPLFPPEYKVLPKNITLLHKTKKFPLSPKAEEVAGFYARLFDHEFTTNQKFNDNFFKDWRKIMTAPEKKEITHLSDCDFSKIQEYYKEKSEEKKKLTKEEKLKLKEDREKITQIYGFCTVDGRKEQVGNFTIEPPGLFRGRGDHPKMGKVKKRVKPSAVTINCGCEDKTKCPAPPKGKDEHGNDWKWAEIIHDNKLSWLACWTDPLTKRVKYIWLNSNSRAKGEKDLLKYNKAMELAKHIHIIRRSYENEWNSKDMQTKQRAVAMYFIDKFALRAGNEKNKEDEADTVGCCTLRVEHIKLDKEFVVKFDFLGKDSIRFQKYAVVDKLVYKNLKDFCKNKKGDEKLFDLLNTSLLNEHLSGLMKGLTAKVFRTYNASHTLQHDLNKNTIGNSSLLEKLSVYNKANRNVALLCNHQRTVPKSHEKSMKNLEDKIKTKEKELEKFEDELEELLEESTEYGKKSDIVRKLTNQIKELKLKLTDKDEGKAIALGTSKLNYSDPRITVAWCKKWSVPIEKLYNKTQQAKFRWAINMVDASFQFA